MGTIDGMLWSWTVDLVLPQELTDYTLESDKNFWSELQGWARWIRLCLYRRQKPTWPAWFRRRKRERWFTFHVMASMWPC